MRFVYKRKYEKVIEWIPFDKLIDLQEIKEINEESDLVFMASWVKGVRIIKAWCQLCDSPKVVQQITNTDKNIEDCIKEFQLRATAFEKVIEWIPFNRLRNTKVIGQEGFGKVYSAIWLDSKQMVEGDISVGYVRFRKKCEVALKTLPGSQAISSCFLNELS
ncbi:hypothetical protein C2G38_2038983 [Gigaspora rosea]|uniref:Protein kinase domain-containing protein n=1 Tax=Gigaspora rosea TaxID=44941 RepID=A0A397V0L8_9GLOM|nr:hypothetical protein C2G38_2038983 [Gigaspora rosea]